MKFETKYFDYKGHKLSYYIDVEKAIVEGLDSYGSVRVDTIVKKADKFVTEYGVRYDQIGIQTEGDDFEIYCIIKVGKEELERREVEAKKASIKYFEREFKEKIAGILKKISKEELIKYIEETSDAVYQI